MLIALTHNLTKQNPSRPALGSQDVVIFHKTFLSTSDVYIAGPSGSYDAQNVKRRTFQLMCSTGWLLHPAESTPGTKPKPGPSWSIVPYSP